MVRLFFLVLFLFAAPAFAAVPQDLQKTLQQQFTQMKADSEDRLTTEGDLTFNGDTITYPAMKATVADKLSYWSIPSMNLTFTGPAKDGKIPFVLKIPETFQQTHVDGRALRIVSLGGQNLTGEWSQKENTIARVDGKLASMTWNDKVYDTTTSAQNIAVQAMSQFGKGDKVDILLHAKGANFQRQPDSFMRGLMPKNLSLTGRIKSLPKALVIFGAVVPIPGLQSTLAQMGTQIDIDDLNMTTANGATLKGNGWFKAAPPASTLPVSGRAALKWENLQQVLTSLQQGFSSGNGDRAQTAQSMVLLMMLQGMGKGAGNSTAYTVDLTPEGQVILNGQNVSAMFVGPNSLLHFFEPKPAPPANPAVPVEPVTDEGAI